MFTCKFDFYTKYVTEILTLKAEFKDIFVDTENQVISQVCCRVL